MDNISPEKCKQVVKDIFSKTRCTGCSNILRSPGSACRNGHGYCWECLGSTSFECRLCPGSAFDTMLLSDLELLNTIVDLLPHKCRYDGCSVFVTSGDDHEESCGYKLRTRDAAKSERADSGEAIAHIIQDHEANPIVSEIIVKDNIRPEKCKQVVKDILSKTRCTVCSNILQPPVFSCRNGHGFCEKCLPTPLKCRLCLGQRFNCLLAHNVLLGSIVDLLPRKCRYDGCSVFVTSGDEREERCGYKLTTRKRAKIERADSGEAIEHIIQDHEANLIDTLTSEDLKNSYDKILKRISCPVCFNSLRPPVAMCENGHSTCPDCKENISACPLCNKSFLNVKIRQLDDVLEVIPHLCRFEGCQVFVKTDDDHEKLCGFRQTDCKMAKCKWKGCVSVLAEHIRMDHIIVYTDSNQNRLNLTHFNPCEKGFSHICPLLVSGKFFWLIITNNPVKEIFKITLAFILEENIKESFQVTFTLKNDKRKYSTSILLVFPENVKNEEEVSICLPSSIVQSYLDSEGILTWDVSINWKRNEQCTSVSF